MFDPRPFKSPDPPLPRSGPGVRAVVEDLPLHDTPTRVADALISRRQAEQFSTPSPLPRSGFGSWRVRSLLVLGAAGLALVATGKLTHRSALQERSNDLPAASAADRAVQTASAVERGAPQRSAGQGASASVRLETTSVIAERIDEPVQDARLAGSSESEASRPVGTSMSRADEIAAVTPPREPFEAVAPLADPPAASTLPVMPPKSEEPAVLAVPSPERTGHNAEAVAAPAVVPDVDAIRLTLGKYERAYKDLDVQAAARIWPSVDRRALSRAFGSIRSQGVNLETCDIDVAADRATVVCRGILRIVPRVGHPEPVTSQQEWLFLMHKADNEWKIGNVTATPRTRRDSVTGTD